MHWIKEQYKEPNRESRTATTIRFTTAAEEHYRNVCDFVILPSPD